MNSIRKSDVNLQEGIRNDLALESVGNMTLENNHLKQMKVDINDI